MRPPIQYTAVLLAVALLAVLAGATAGAAEPFAVTAGAAKLPPTTAAAPGRTPASQPASTAATDPSLRPDLSKMEPVEQLHEALRLLQAGRYAEADRIATSLAGQVPRPMPRAWLVAAAARQQARQYAAAIEAYKAFLSSSDTQAGREYVSRQLRLCEAASEPAADAAPPSSRLSADRRKELSAVSDDEVTETSEHFIVRARNAPLAKLVAQEAEIALGRICRLILGGQEYPQRVTIHLWADRQDYLAHTPGATEWSGGRFTLGQDSAGAATRTIDLAQLDEKKAFDPAMLDRALPHELCHLVTAELFGDAPCPLYLSEGLAMLAEWELDNGRLGLAGTALAGKGKIPLADLLVVPAGRIEKPDLFYAESYSLLLYLRQRLSDRQFADLIENLKSGLPLCDALQRALHAPDNPDFLKTLEAAWEKHAIDQAQYNRALQGATAPAAE